MTFTNTANPPPTPVRLFSALTNTSRSGQPRLQDEAPALQPNSDPQDNQSADFFRGK